MTKINEVLKFDENSLVHLDIKTKGWKTLSKLLDKKGVKWTNEKDPNATHIVCTRYASESLNYLCEKILNPLWETKASAEDKERFKEVLITDCDVIGSRYVNFTKVTCNLRYSRTRSNLKIFNGGESVESNGICKFILSYAWEVYKCKKVYSFKNFKNILENENRTEINEDDKNKITNLLKSGDHTNIKLALLLTENYTLQEEWIPWLKLNSNFKEVRNFLKSNNIWHLERSWFSNTSLDKKIKYIKHELYSHINFLTSANTNKDELIKEILKF